MTTKYIAKHEGKIVGKRTTKDRTYTHAIVVQDVEEAARKAAYNYTSNKTDSSNFEYWSVLTKQGRLHPHLSASYHSDAHVAAEVAKAQAIIDGGFDAYVRRLRERAIAGFEKRKADGGFEPFVVAWAGRLDLAQKAAAQHTWASRKLIAIVPAEIA